MGCKRSTLSDSLWIVQWLGWTTQSKNAIISTKIKFQPRFSGEKLYIFFSLSLMDLLDSMIQMWWGPSRCLISQAITLLLFWASSMHSFRHNWLLSHEINVARTASWAARLTWSVSTKRVIQVGQVRVRPGPEFQNLNEIRNGLGLWPQITPSDPVTFLNETHWKTTRVFSFPQKCIDQGKWGDILECELWTCISSIKWF